MALGSPQWMYKSGEAYTIDQSLKFNKSESVYLSKTPASDGNLKTWTYSIWIKRGVIDGSNHNLISTDNDQLTIKDNKTIDFTFAGGNQVFRTNRLFRDSSAWMHILLAVDTTQGTASNRAKLYINGIQETSFSASSYPSQNTNGQINDASYEHKIGKQGASTLEYLDGYLAEVNFIDGQALTAADFGETGDYGEWKPKEYSGTYGTNGFYLPFKNDYTVEGFSTVTWKGNGVSGNYIGGTGFKPDFTWIKERSGPYSHVLANPFTSTGKFLNANSTDGESSDPTKFQNLTTDGFTVGTHAGVNSNGQTYVAWNWDMGADTPTGFGCVTYTGNGTSGRQVGNVGFKPDLVWISGRSNGESSISDSVRGSKYSLFAEGSDAEDSGSNIRSFDSDGFTVSDGNRVNQNNRTLVAWCWNMGGTTVTNTSGSLNSEVRANTTYGQSIVSYTGNGASSATIGHGLSSAPEMMIVRSRGSNAWAVYHTSIGNTHLMELNTSAAKADNNTFWNDTSPTNSVFTIGSHGEVNANNTGFIAYCFHSVSGYSKFGSYTGNGASSGPTITTGFRPAYVMVKNADSSGNGWYIFDSTRSNFGVANEALDANDTTSEQNYTVVEFLSDGFKIHGTYGFSNTNGEKHIYMAFAGGMDSISDYNTDGSIDSRVKANTTYGQSIVSYTGTGSATTVGHGLDSSPEMIMVKCRGSATAGDWIVSHTGIGMGSGRLILNQTDANSTSGASVLWNSTAPTSTVFSIGNYSSVNQSNLDFIAYCFHSVTGYSKFGSYSGDGSTDGSNAVNCGFEPAFVMIKCTNDTESWWIFDNARNPLNDDTDPKRIAADSDNAEVTGGSTGSDWVEFTSTGFKMTGSGGGTNGGSGQEYIYAAFADKREYAYWLDQSGNNNDWTSNNLTESDISVDSPTNNFATYNPLYEPLGTYTEGNLKWIGPGAWAWTPSTIALPTTGKWYFETMLINNGRNANDTYGSMGVMRSQTERQSDNWSRIRNDGCLMTDGYLGYNFSTTDSFTGTENKYAKDILSCAIDRDNNTFNFRLNNVSIWSGTLASSATESLNFVVVSHSSSYGGSMIANFGQDSSFAGNKTPQGKQDGNDIGDFFYEPPSGYLTLCTDNLPDVDVVPSEHFNTTLFTGDGTSNRDITGTGFNPDLNWLKMRSSADNNVITDVMRGTNHLHTNDTSADSDAGYPALVTDGFRVSGGNYNNSGYTFVAWQWKANGSGSSNSNGSITSTVSANVDAGFSIVSYTGNGSAGATVGHGLSKAPEMVIIKHREHTGQWQTYHHSVRAPNAEDYFLMLNATDAAATDGSASRWNNTDPSSTVVTLGTDWEVNDNTKDYIMYCFHSVDGYCKVGAYKGNSSTDGTFAYTGFAPAYILVKSFDETRNWHIMDSTRNPNNVANHVLYANRNNAEYSDNAYTDVDFLSNGFKLRNNDTAMNRNGQEHLYLAIAEIPFKHSNGR